MTIREMILGYPGLGDVSTELMTATLTVRELSAADEFSADVVKPLNLAIADLLVAAVNSPDFKENKLSVTYKEKAMLRSAIRLYRANGEPEKANELSKSDVKIPMGRAPKRW